MRRVDFKREDGFTVVELLVAAILLVIGIGATLTVLNSSGRASSTAERHEVGVAQAQQAIEQVRALPYNQVGLTAPPPASQAAGDPSSRVAGTNFRTVGTSEENLVLPGDPKVSSPQVAPYSTVTVGSGSGATTAKVYRYVTWRNDSCPLIPANLLALVSGNNGNGGGTVSFLNGLVASLDNQLIPSLQGLVTNIDGATSSLNGILNVLVGTVLNAANGIKAKGADLRPAAAALLSTVGGTRTGLINLNNSLQALSNISFCSLDLALLADIRNRLNQLQNSGATGLFDTLNSNVHDINQTATEFGKVIGQSCGALNLLCVLGNTVGNLIVSVNNTLASLEPTLKADLLAANSPTLQQIAAEIAALDADVATLAASATTSNPKSSKRVTVAVVLDPAGQVGPKQPIWMTTVIADPKAGLL